jgi:hypothetical protein
MLASFQLTSAPKRQRGRSIEALSLWNELSSPATARAEYRNHGEAGLLGQGAERLLVAKWVHLAIAALALHSVPALESEAEAIVGDIADSETIARTRRRQGRRAA